MGKISSQRPELRHLLQVIGGFFISRAVTRGLDSDAADVLGQILASGESVDMIIGLVVSVATFVWFKIEARGWFKAWFK